LILRKGIKIVATRCHILQLKCIKFDFGWDSAPDPAGELTALPRPPSWIWGCLLLRKRGKGKNGKGEKGRGRGGGRGDEVGEGDPPLFILQIGHWLQVYDVMTLLH